MDAADLKQISEFLIDSALSQGTKTAYNRAKAIFEEFLSKYFPGSTSVPVTSEQVVLFISYCYQKELAPQTVATYMSAIAHFNKVKGLPDPTQGFIVKRAMQGFQKTKFRSDLKLPITPSILRKLIESLPHCTNSFYQRCLFKAMYLTAFHAFLRVGEITGSSKKSCLLFTSIEFGYDVNSSPVDLKITMSKFKHHHGKHPIILLLQCNEDKVMCPVNAVWEYTKVRGQNEGPLFMFQDKAPVSRQYFTQQLKTSLIFSNYDTKYYKAHSFRIGAAT